MTSMPASRSARAMIFAPRSWPSRPGFATTTLSVRGIAGSLVPSPLAAGMHNVAWHPAGHEPAPAAAGEREDEVAGRNGGGGRRHEADAEHSRLGGGQLGRPAG